MAVLIVYCMKDIPSGGISAVVPKLLAATVVFITYKWKHQTLIFILLGTISYMMLLHLVTAFFFSCYAPINTFFPANANP